MVTHLQFKEELIVLEEMETDTMDTTQIILVVLILEMAEAVQEMAEAVEFT